MIFTIGVIFLFTAWLMGELFLPPKKPVGAILWWPSWCGLASS